MSTAKGKYQRNRSLLLKELKKAPKDSDLHFYLACTYLMTGEFAQLFFHLDEAIAHNQFRGIPKEAACVCKMVVLLNIFKHPDNNLFAHLVKHYLHACPDNPELLACKGIILARQRNFAPARYYLEKSLALVKRQAQIFSFYNDLRDDVHKILREIGGLSTVE